MTTEAPETVPAVATADAPEQEIEPDDHAEVDSAYDEGDLHSETTSVTSSILRGHVENGRKYQTLKEGYWGPSDEKQFETMELNHLMFLVHDHKLPNPFFRSPITSPKRILDVGTGKGTWAMDVADKFPETIVHGIDLYPPPSPWVPPNCYLEVDDALQEWTWRDKFDLIHIRLLFGAFTDSEWDEVYANCFKFIKPGGWIEQVEGDVRVHSDDGTVPPDSCMASWGPQFVHCGEQSGRKLDTVDSFKSRIEKAGFEDVHDEVYKFPVGRWPKDELLKEIGKINLAHWDSGLEGWAMWLLTKFGSPTPWSKDEVLVYVAKMKLEMKDPKIHAYVKFRRVWARKPEQTRVTE